MRTVCTLAVCLLVCGCSGKKADDTMPLVTYKELSADWKRWEGKRIRVRAKATENSVNEIRKVAILDLGDRDGSFRCMFPLEDAHKIQGLRNEVTVEGRISDHGGGNVTLTDCKIIDD